MSTNLWLLGAQLALAMSAILTVAIVLTF